MLFAFNIFWKTILFLVASWTTWALLGYEFTAITLLALLVARGFKNNSSVF